ncbi:MAG: DNA/RNA non-specific endonuclease [Alphaproteobacteria bacterium]|nr:DNA/RNA non-specific endonuclease [Alphaproteobacteria bacterium]
MPFLIPIFAVALAASPLLESQCLAGCPAGMEGLHVVDHGALRLANDAQTKFAGWVAYKVSRETLGPTRPRNWRKDPDLGSDETLSESAYDGANKALHTDRGHQAALASLAGHPAWETTNYLSNITPQSSALNQGPWEHLEEGERKLAKAGKVAYVLTGPLYERAMADLPNAPQAVIPSGYWKIIAVQGDGNAVATAAFVMDQTTPRDADFCTHQVPVGEIERRAGLVFFNHLPAPIHAATVAAYPGSLAGEVGCR